MKMDKVESSRMVQLLLLLLSSSFAVFGGETRNPGDKIREKGE
jgi:hypothetical protein